MAPSVDSSSTHYALVVDAGSSGSRLQIYSWRDPGLERDEILREVRAARNAGLGTQEDVNPDAAAVTNKWWWWDSFRRKGKGRATAEEMERRALRRLVRVGKGVRGDEWVKRVEPGISTVAPEDIPGYLEPLLSHALRHVPPSQQVNTPIYVLATAGMRLLSKEAQDAILEETCSTLRNSYPFKLDSRTDAGPCGDSVRIISGEEEGIWGWVAVNYLMDGFGHAPTLSHSAEQTEHDHLLPLPSLAKAPEGSSALHAVTPVDVHHHSPTFGFLDMGGASTQLAFSPTAEELSQSRFPADKLAKISLRLLSGEQVEWPVFAASWLGFGTNRVRERYVAKAIAEWSAHADGSSRPEVIQDACLPVDLVVPSPDKSKHPDFVGTGSFSTCLDSLKPLLGHDEPCGAEHCLFGGMATPRIDFHRSDQRGFIGISEYWYTAHQVLGLGGVWDWAEWERGMGAFCAQPWSEIEAKVKSEDGWADVDLSRLQMQCFKGAWISNVLHDGIGVPRLTDAGGNDTLAGEGGMNAEAEFRARQKGLFQSMDTVRNTAISWTLGKVVIEASRAVAALPSGRWLPLAAAQDHLTSLPAWVVFAYAAVALLLLFAAMRKRRRLLSIPIPLPAFLRSADDKGLYVEEGEPSLAPVPKRRRWKLFHRLTANLGFKPQRQAAMPLSNAGQWQGLGLSASQPPSPRSGMRSGGARSASMLDIASYPSYPGFATPGSGASSSVASTPRPARPRTASYNTHDGGSGWNDPPMSMFAPGTPSLDESSSADDHDDWPPRPKGKGKPKKHSSALAPSAGPGGDRVLSRNSSRVNLSEHGHLAQRTASRGSTPQRDM